jgi:hypothetical protein
MTRPRQGYAGQVGFVLKVLLAALVATVCAVAVAVIFVFAFIYDLMMKHGGLIALAAAVAFLCWVALEKLP